VTFEVRGRFEYHDYGLLGCDVVYSGRYICPERCNPITRCRVPEDSSNILFPHRLMLCLFCLHCKLIASTNVL